MQNNLLHPTNFYKSLGLAEIVGSTRKINKILRAASFSPDFSYEAPQDRKGRTFYDRYKYLGNGFGVNVIGYRKLRRNKEGQMIDKHVVMDWGIFALGHNDIRVANSFIDMDEHQLGYCFTEDTKSGNAFEFRINNMLELHEKYKKLGNLDEVAQFEKDIPRINMAMLMLYGTVLLPVDKSDPEAWHNPDEEVQRELLTRARAGDARAEINLAAMAAQQEQELRHRLQTEDLLSVFEGYFLNMTEQSGIFSILAEITAVEDIVNTESKEYLYRLILDITDTSCTVYINKKDLIGYPTAGMRLMGIGLLQGVIRL